MLPFRLLRVLLHLFQGLAICALLFPLIDGAVRQAHVQRWSAQLLALCGVRLQLLQPHEMPAAPRALIVANHVSWLDIFAINSVQPCRFVAKSDIRGWPLIGWLCARVGTIFIARGKLREVRKIYQGLVESLQAGEHVAFFPEGTTAAQGMLLPFHANLFEAAIEAQVPIQPYAIRYLDAEGKLHPAADFIDNMSFAQSIAAVLKSSGMTAQLILLPAIATSGNPHRRELADTVRAAIAQTLDARKQGRDQIEPGR